MPIITPAYPSMCSTHNVCYSTFEVMKAELKRASQIVDRIPLGHGSWSELFDQHDFFSKYRYYLQITASSATPEVQLKWAGTVESKIRHLVAKLELVDMVQLVHPFIKGIDRIFFCLNDEEGRQITSGGTISPAVGARTEEDIEGKEGASKVYTTNWFLGMQVETKPKGASGNRRLDLSYPTSEFAKLVRSWDKFEAETMGIVVRYQKAAQLPDYVYEGLEKPPTPAKGNLKRAKVCCAVDLVLSTAGRRGIRRQRSSRTGRRQRSSRSALQESANDRQ